MAKSEQQFDLIICGGGMVGLLLANALAPHRLSIAIVETSAQPPAWNRDQFDLRVSAITRASQRILETLGVWPAMAGMRISPFREMQVWDGTGDGVIHFDSADIGQDCLGHIVENSVIQLALFQRLTSFGNVHWLQPAIPSELSAGEHHLTLTLEDRRQLTAGLIVGADGGSSWVRQQAGIGVQTTDYQQSAVVATVKTEQHHRETAWQRFMPTGPLAFLPLSDGYSSIVWSTTPEHAATLVSMDDTAFCQTLAEGFDFTLGEVLETSARAAFPLRSQHAQHYVQPRLALIGDAAHTIHPLAGQGVNLGFADAATLAEVLLDAVKAKQDIGGFKTLRRYERWRKGDNLAMLSIMTSFKNLFGSSNSALTTLRNSGLTITNKLTPVKNTIIRHAMGLAGDLPRLARCEPL